jgi:transposase InsO family protein
VRTCRWDFVSVRAKTFGVQRICRALRVSRPGCCRWIASAKTRQERKVADDALLMEIREIRTQHNGTCGVRRVHAALRGFVHTVSRKRITVPGRLAPPAPDLVQRDFSAMELDEKWCDGITYVQLGGSWLYLACVLDICSRRVIGWSMASHMRAELVIDALQMAVAVRGGNVEGVALP